MERWTTEVTTAAIGAVQRMGRPKRGACSSLVEMPIPSTTSTAPMGSPFAVSQNNSTIYLFDYFNFFGLKGRYDREAVEKWGLKTI
jgi:hypothetical protein